MPHRSRLTPCALVALLIVSACPRDRGALSDDGKPEPQGLPAPGTAEGGEARGQAAVPPAGPSGDTAAAAPTAAPQGAAAGDSDGDGATEAAGEVSDSGPREGERLERFAFYIGDQRVGRFVAIDRVDAKGRLELVRQSDLALRRGTDEIRLSMRTVSVLEADLRPVRFAFEREEGTGAVIRSEGVVRQGKVKIKTTAGGATTERTVILDEGVTFAAALEVRSRRGLKDGDSFKGKVLLEEVGAVIEASYKTRSTPEGYVIEGVLAGIQQIEKLDKNGKTLRIEVPAMGGYAVPEGAAPPPLKTSLDVLARTVWPAPPDMPPAAELSAAIFRIEGSLSTPVPEDRRQRVLEQRDKVYLVRVERAVRGAPEKLSAQARKEALAETPYEPIADPRIVAAATQATLGLSTAEAKVAQLVRFVYERIEEKDLTRAYAPAPETLETGVGDCTEHSVLFSALAKASGIPTRLVDGVIVADGMIGYHEWVEVYLDGEGWRPVDPTFGEAKAGPNRLKLATGSSQPEALLRMGLSAASALTGLKIKVTAHER